MRSFIHHRGLVPKETCAIARRRLGLELRRCGVTQAEIIEWASNSWWPSLRWEPEFNAVRAPLERWVQPGDVWAETQILIRLPDEDGTPLGTPHVDTLPPWAEEQGMRYKAIYGVELAPVVSGRTVMYLDEGMVQPHTRIGDVLEMRPDVFHSGSPNLGGEVRMALFFRLLTPL